MTREAAADWGLSGVLLRSTGTYWDLRKSLPYEIYAELDFTVPIVAHTGGLSDNFDRFIMRTEEMRQSLSLINQCLNLLDAGEIKADYNYKITPPAKQALKKSMEVLIDHFKLYSEGYIVPSGETYVGIESPKGEFGVFITSSGSNKPYRCKVRSPGFFHLQSLKFLCQNVMLADVVAIIGSIDVVFGEIDR